MNKWKDYTKSFQEYTSIAIGLIAGMIKITKLKVHNHSRVFNISITDTDRGYIK